MGNHTKNIHPRFHILLFMYIIFTALFSISLFMYGFFSMDIPTNSFSSVSDIPEDIEGFRVNRNYLYKPSVKKVILMVVDALRWDFVNDAHKSNSMPATSNSIKNNTACLLQVKVSAPTVTMPRIKAMTTGMIPNFIEVALNFGKSEIQMDSVLHQAKSQGHNLIFYGDDTWLKLFPNIFFRHEGTTSFYVSDFTEVDENVTRHINEELHEKEDWSIMILHYLGLDHIGHVFGPQSPLIKPKLREMDDVINQIRMKIIEWNRNDIPSMLIVCGDHGMKDSGGHGGATPEETLVPLVAFGADCPMENTKSYPRQIEQIDIATTLAVLLGLPIPSSNLGTITLEMVKNHSSMSKLYMLYYNAQQIHSHFQKLSDYKSTQTYSKYLRTIKFHSNLLRENGEFINTERVHTLIDMYRDVLQDMKKKFVKSTIKYDLPVMSVAIILMGQLLILMMSFSINNFFSMKNFLFWCLSSVILWTIIIHGLNFNNDDIFSDLHSTPFFLKLSFLALIIINCCILSKSSCFFSIEIFYNPVKFISVDVFFIFFLIHIISLTSSSFIEEEHQTWYFFSMTFLIYTIYCHVTNFILNPAKKINQKHMTLFLKTILLVVLNRILRKFNSTGNKYANLPDIKLWLEESESNIYMSLLLITGLVLLIILGFINEDKKYRTNTLIFHIFISTCIYHRHTKDVKIPFFYPESQGIYEVWVFWIAFIFFILHYIQRFFHSGICRKKTKISNQIIFLFVQIWVMITALLHRPHNVILLPMQIITNLIVNDLMELNLSCRNNVYISYLIGNVFYYYQGNSNSLATIDVAAGYVGLKSYRPVLATIFLSVNTFSAPILAYLMLILKDTKDYMNHFSPLRISSINQQCIILRFFPIVFYTIFVSIERYHLFVWTVFSPKLIYEAIYCTVFFFFVCIVQSIFFSTRNQ